MTKHKCPKKPVKKQPGEDGFFFPWYLSKTKDGKCTIRIVVTRDDQLPPALQADCEGRPLSQRPTVMPVSRYTGKPGKKPE